MRSAKVTILYMKGGGALNIFQYIEVTKSLQVILESLPSHLTVERLRHFRDGIYIAH